MTFSSLRITIHRGDENTIYHPRHCPLTIEYIGTKIHQRTKVNAVVILDGCKVCKLLGIKKAVNACSMSEPLTILS